jgi:single-strand DNA-binding protein
MSNFNYNKAIIGGKITADIELKQTSGGAPVCSFTIAVNRRKSAEGKQEADFINCVAWRHNAEFISKFFKKGSSICITGTIQNRTWEQDGQKRYATEIIVEEACFVDSKNESNQASGQPSFTNMEAVPFEQMSADDDFPF